MKSSSQWHGKHFAIFISWIILCFNWSQPNAFKNSNSSGNYFPFCAHLCICHLCCSATGTFNRLLYSLYYYHLYGYGVCYLFLLKLFHQLNQLHRTLLLLQNENLKFKTTICCWSFYFKFEAQAIQKHCYTFHIELLKIWKKTNLNVFSKM